MKNKNYLFIIFALIVTVIHNLSICSYIKDFIIPLFLILSLYLILIKKKEYVNKRAFYLLIPIFLVLISGVIFEIDDINMGLNVIVLPILYTIFLFSLTNKNYHISYNGLFWIFKLFPNKLFSNLKLLDLSTFKNKDNFKKISKLIIGIIAGVLVGKIFLDLLSLEDVYFSMFIEKYLNIHISIRFGNIILFIFSFIISFSIYNNLLNNKNELIKELKIYKIDNLMVISFLSIINSVFILFLISEISKVTTNFLKLPIEYTYSEYAREGFFELLFISFINYIIILFLIYKSKIVNNNKIVKWLVVLLIIFSMILIGNSSYRMILYILAFGFTTLRMQVILFLIMEMVIFIILLMKIFNKINNESIKFFIIMISFYILNLYICIPSIADILNKWTRL